MKKESTSTITNTNMDSGRVHQHRRDASSVEDLEVFKLAHQLALEVYRTTKEFPADERFGLTNQARRAAASVCANLSEGAGRLNRAEYRQFVGIAKGSAAETSYHLLLARDLKFLSEEGYRHLRSGYDSVGRMLTRLTQALSVPAPIPTPTRR